jgi:uncharacterized protein
MIPRHLAGTLLDRARAYPVVTVTGPRQSGKTTLVRATFPGHAYVTLEDPDERAFALEDPRGFLRRWPGGAVLDEVQRAPDLVSYLQGMVDDDPRPGRFILTGSQNLLVLRGVSQSLAGRSGILHLLPLSGSELSGRPPLDPRALGEPTPAPAPDRGADLMGTLFAGFYPRIHDRGMDPTVWLSDYYRTYVERDVRELLNVGDLETFGRFVRLCAGRSGQILNVSGLAADAGVSHTTARRWLSVLEASFLVVLLRPHFRSFNKRLTKSPKLHFLDTGLLCYLLRIGSPAELLTHSARGAVFETFVVSELLKAYAHRGEDPALWYWRDAAGHEMDILVDLGDRQVPVEVKSGATVAGDFLDALRYWRGLAGDAAAPAALVYGGDTSFTREGVAVRSWRDL